MEDKNKESMKSKEIDILSSTKKIFAEKRLLAIFLCVFLVIGIIYAFNKPKEYTSSVVLAPEMSSMGMSQNISDLAGMVGLNVGNNKNSVDAIYPEIYPEIFASSDFVIKLFDIPVKLQKENITKSYYQHLKTDIKMPFWSYPGIWISKLFSPRTIQSKSNKINPSNLTKEQFTIFKKISGNISCQLNKGTNVITIFATDVDPNVAACLADTLQRRLQEYIMIYRTKKARNDLYYAKKLNTEAKAQYIKSQQIYASYADANTDAVLQSYKSRMEYLENEMQLKYNNYTQTAQQVVQALAKVQENSPAFTIIQGATVPLQSSSTPRSLIILIFILIGFVFDSLWVLFVRDYCMKIVRKKGEK